MTGRCERQGSFCPYCGYRACLKAKPIIPRAAITQTPASGKAEVATVAERDKSREENPSVSRSPEEREGVEHG
jgi:hypothetical protein